MTIETKYSVLDQVWYLDPGSRKCEYVTIHAISTKSKDFGTDEDVDVRTDIRYNLSSSHNSTVGEDELFATKEELLASL